MSSDQVVPVAPVGTPQALEEDFAPPGFEFELEENIGTSSLEALEDAAAVPDFQSHRHPHTKLFVVVFAILGNAVLIYQAARDIPREFRAIFCHVFGFDTCTLDEDRGASIIESIEFFFHVNMEFLFPLAMIFCFFITQLSISVMPGLAFKMSNPIPMISRVIYVTMILHCLTNILTSIAMLPYLGTTPRESFWTEYLVVSAFGLFWMHQMLNLGSFSRLTTLNFIRARENFQFRQNALLEF